MWKNITIASFIYASTKIFAGVVIILLAELMSKKEYANFSYYYAITTGIAAFLQSGIFESSASRMDKSGSEHTIRVQLSLTLKRLCASGLMLLTISYFIVAFIDTNLEILSFLCAVVIGIVIAAGNISSSVLRLTSETKKALLALLLTTITTSIGYFLGASIYGTTEAALMVSATIGCIILLYIYIDLKLVHGEYDFDKYKKVTMANIVRDYQIVSLLGWISGYGINLILYKLLPSSVVADFFLLYTLTAALTMLATSINTAWTPVFIKMSHVDQNSALKINRKVSRALLLSMSFFSVVVIAITSALLDISVGYNLVHVIQNTHYLSVCLAAILICIPLWEIQNYYVRDGASRKYSRYTIFSSILGLLGWIAMVFLFQERGVYWGFFFMNFAKTTFFVINSSKNSYYASTYWPALFLAAIVILFGF